jgi:cell wall assembly regulator SMI1
MDPLLRHTIEQLARFAPPGGGVDAREIDAAERALGVTFPPDIRPLAAVFRGGDIGEKLHHFSWSPADPINIVERTRHLCAQGLPDTAVALAVSGRVLHAMVFHTAYPKIHS